MDAKLKQLLPGSFTDDRSKLEQRAGSILTCLFLRTRRHRIKRTLSRHWGWGFEANQTE